MMGVKRCSVAISHCYWACSRKRVPVLIIRSGRGPSNEMHMTLCSLHIYMHAYSCREFAFLRIGQCPINTPRLTIHELESEGCFN